MRFGWPQRRLTWCESTSRDSPENKQSSSEFRNSLHRSVRVPIVNPAGAPSASPHGEPPQKRGAYFLGIQWVTYWSVLETFFFCFFFGRFQLRHAPIQVIWGFLPLVPPLVIRNKTLDGSFSTCISVCFLRPVPTPQGARWDHPSTHPPQTPPPPTPIRSNYSVEFRQEGRDSEWVKLNIPGEHFSSEFS